MKMEKSMVERIEEQLNGLPKEEVVELKLDNCETILIEGLTDEFKKLTSLSLVNCGLTTLKGFPNLPELTKLELSDNKLAGTLNLLVEACPKLTSLYLSGNPILEVSALEPLKDLANLKKIDLDRCLLKDSEGYSKEKVLELLPQITCLDDADQIMNGDKKENKDEKDGGDEKEAEEGEAEEGEAEEGEVKEGEEAEVKEGEEAEVKEGEEAEVKEGEEKEAEDGEVKEDDEEEEEEDEEEDEEEVGLSYLQKSGLEEESDGEDFQPNGANDEEEDDDDEEDEEDMEDELAGVVGEGGENESPAVPRGRGVKRKRALEEEESEKVGKEEKTSKPEVEETPATETTAEEKSNGE